MSVLILTNDIFSIILLYLDQIDIRNLRLAHPFFWKMSHIREKFKLIQKIFFNPETVPKLSKSLISDAVAKEPPTLGKIKIDMEHLLTYTVSFFIPEVKCWIRYYFQCDLTGFQPQGNCLFWFRRRWIIDPENMKEKYCSKEMIKTLDSLPKGTPQLNHVWKTLNPNSSIRKHIRDDYQKYRDDIEKNSYSVDGLYYIFKNGNYSFGPDPFVLKFDPKL